jgi:hypothetical protein
MERRKQHALIERVNFMRSLHETGVELTHEYLYDIGVELTN